MEIRRRVAVCDNSLYMAGISASLKSSAGLDVLSVDLDTSNPRENLDLTGLSAIVFDLSDPALCLDSFLLRDRPGLLLIGVDPCKNEMLVLSSQAMQALSVADLVNVIRGEDSSSRAFIKESNSKS